jgi:hypothetical protein
MLNSVKSNNVIKNYYAKENNYVDEKWKKCNTSNAFGVSLILSPSSQDIPRAVCRTPGSAERVTTNLLASEAEASKAAANSEVDYKVDNEAVCSDV